MILKGKKVFLRHPLITDSFAMLIWENDPEVWAAGDNDEPFSKEDIDNFINEGQDVEKFSQERMIICLNDNELPIGCIDLYDYEPKHSRAGIGILIYDKINRNKGFGSEALELMIEYSANILNMKQIYCHIEEGNESSLRLFKQFNFQIVGLKKDWRKRDDKWINEYLLQLILK